MIATVGGILTWFSAQIVEHSWRRHYRIGRTAVALSIENNQVVVDVASKHHRALMLFATFHLMHYVGGSTVSIYEKDYPNVTLAISDLGTFDTDSPSLFDSKFVNWPIPALARAKGTWLGALDLDHFLPPPTRIDEDCNVHQSSRRCCRNRWKTWLTRSFTSVLRIWGWRKRSPLTSLWMAITRPNCSDSPTQPLNAAARHLD